MVILIPAYEPDKRLLELIHEIKKNCPFHIVVVDDGSGNAYKEIFQWVKNQGCTVLAHKKNMGKGQALKTGFGYIKLTGENEGVVCADSDGQHLPADIMKIAREVERHRNHIVLGCRHFTGKVPLRSRFGNWVTRFVFAFSTGSKIYDTQTGLRGYSADMLDWLCSISGQRFEYEMNMLLEASREGYSFYSVDIDTVYHKNHSSHFRTIADSARVYFPILKFSGASIMSALLDFGILAAVYSLTSNLLLAVIFARILSSAFNYTVNRTFVFKAGMSVMLKKSLPRYYTLAAVILLFNYCLMNLFNIQLGIPLLCAKLLTETTLYLFSFWSQRKFVFAH
jgi:glycosyltransferase involved in cell wall biosynthesis